MAGTNNNRLKVRNGAASTGRPLIHYRKRLRLRFGFTTQGIQNPARLTAKPCATRPPYDILSLWTFEVLICDSVLTRLSMVRQRYHAAIRTGYARTGTSPAGRTRNSADSRMNVSGPGGE